MNANTLTGQLYAARDRVESERENLPVSDDWSTDSLISRAGDSLRQASEMLDRAIREAKNNA